MRSEKDGIGLLAKLENLFIRESVYKTLFLSKGLTTLSAECLNLALLTKWRIVTPELSLST